MTRSWRARIERLIESVLFACAALSIVVTLGIISVLAVETLQFFREVSPVDFLFGTVSVSYTHLTLPTILLV